MAEYGPQVFFNIHTTEYGGVMVFVTDFSFMTVFVVLYDIQS